MDKDVEYQQIKPDGALSHFVESFWLLRNRSASDKPLVILPDGRIDLIFSQSASQLVHITLLGIETHPDKALLPAQTQLLVISFKLLAAEYIFQKPIASLLNKATPLPRDFWHFQPNNLTDLDAFSQKATRYLQALLPPQTDKRKADLFALLYATNGSLPVNQLAQGAGWSSRQMNRYFNQQFGLSLKAYCNILRFRASFTHIKQGRLFPQENFADQSHFVKQIKKWAGVLPKELNRNENDRFVQFSVLPQQ